MRRILLVLTVALVMAVMLAVMAAPAFAAGQKKGQNNTNPGLLQNNDNTGVSLYNGSSKAGGDVQNNANPGNRFGDVQN